MSADAVDERLALAMRDGRIERLTWLLREARDLLVHNPHPDLRPSACPGCRLEMEIDDALS